MKKKYLYNGKLLEQSDVEDAAKQSGLDINTYIQKAGLKSVEDNYSFNGKTFTAEDILDAANQSKLGFDDYIQKAGFEAIKKKDVGVSPTTSNGNGLQSKEDENTPDEYGRTGFLKKLPPPTKLSQSTDPINDALIVAKEKESVARNSGQFNSYLKAKEAVTEQKNILNSIGNNGTVGKQAMDNIIGDNSDKYSIDQLKQKSQGNITATKAVQAIEDKRKTDEAINTTTDFYKAANKKYSGKENEFQSDIPVATQGENVKNFLNDPNVIQRAKTDLEFAIKYKEAKYNWMKDFPEEASKDVNQRIGQYMEDNGMASTLYNNPGKEKVDKAVSEMREKGLLDEKQFKLYDDKTRPDLGTLHSMLWGSPIPTADIVNTFTKSLEKNGNDVIGGIRDIADKISFGTISKFGESDEDRQKRILEQEAETPTVEPKGEGKKMVLGITNLAGFATPMILGEMAGIPTMATMTAQFEGSNRKTAMNLYPDDKTKQDIYTILGTTLDVVAGQKLPIGEAANTLKGLVSDVVDGKITQEAAKDQFNMFIQDAAKNTASGANAMALMQVGHNGLEAALGGKDFKVGEQAKQLLEQYPKDILNMAFLGGVAAAKHFKGEVETNEQPTIKIEPEKLFNEKLSFDQKYKKVETEDMFTGEKKEASVRNIVRTSEKQHNILDKLINCLTA